MTGAFVILGLLIALLSPKEYETGATLMPENESGQSMAGNLLDQYGGLLGMSGGNINLEQDGGISPQLYPQIVQSLPFQLELLNKEVTFSSFDTTTTVYHFLDEVYSPLVFSSLLDYSINLPGKVVGLFSNDELDFPLPQGFGTDSVVAVTKAQLGVINDLRDRVTVSLNEETGVINLKVVMPDPNAASQIGKEGIVLIKEYVTNYRTRKAQEDLEYAQVQLQESRSRFEATQNRLAEFRDSNRNLATAKAKTQEERLQSEYELAFNVYNTLAQQVEQAKLKVQEQTPVVSILQPIQVPVDDTTSGLSILVMTTFVGFLGALGYVTLNSLFFT